MATINDIVLIHLEESPVSFARIESILPDAKKDWYHVKLLMLQIPLQVVTWILKDEYINGEEFFMNGKQMRLKKVECPVEEFSPLNSNLSSKTEKEEKKEDQQPGEPESNAGASKPADIISFADLKNKDSK